MATVEVKYHADGDYFTETVSGFKRWEAVQAEFNRIEEAKKVVRKAVDKGIILYIEEFHI